MPSELDAIRDRLTKAAQSVGYIGAIRPVLLSNLKAAEAELAAASTAFDEWVQEQRELLTEYGRHMEGCNYPHGGEYGCKCGFLAILEREAQTIE